MPAVQLEDRYRSSTPRLPASHQCDGDSLAGNPGLYGLTPHHLGERLEDEDFGRDVSVS